MAPSPPLPSGAIAVDDEQSNGLPPLPDGAASVEPLSQQATSQRPSVPPMPAGGYGSQSSEQIVRNQTGIQPFQNPVLKAAAGFGRSLAAPVTGLVTAGKALFAEPTFANDEEKSAWDKAGPLGLGLQRTLVAPAQAAHQTAQGLRQAGHPLLAAGAELGAIPLIGPMGQSLGQRAAAGDATGAVTEGLTNSLLPLAAQEGIPALRRAGSSARQWRRPATSTSVVPTAEQAGAALAKAINPPGGVPEGFEDSTTTQTPGILDHAARTGNPLNTRWELARAALGHAQEWNNFFDDEVLGPTKNRPVPVAGNQGPTRMVNGAPTATLGQIDARLTEINHLLRPAGNMLNSGATMTALERSGLTAEANALKSTLYNELANDTGLPPETIKLIRENYGQSYEIAARADAARRGVTDPRSIPTSKAAIIHSIGQKVLGGADAIADRNVQSALQKFKPATSPMENYRNQIAQTQAQKAAATAANQAAAQQEVLHGTDLDQDVQSQVAQRAAAARALRDQNNAAALAKAQQEVLHGTDLDQDVQSQVAQRAAAARALRDQNNAAALAKAQQEVLKAHELQTGAQDAAAQRARQAAIERDAAAHQEGQTPQGQPDTEQLNYRTGQVVPAASPLPSPGVHVNWKDLNLGVGPNRTAVPLGDEAAPLAQADENRFQVHNINAAVEKGNTFNATKWRMQNPGRDVEAAKNQARELGYTVRTPAMGNVKYRNGEAFTQNPNHGWWEPKE